MNTKQQLREAEEAREALRLEKGRIQARNAVLMQLLSYLARNGQKELAQRYLRMADAAAADVRREDFVRVTLS